MTLGYAARASSVLALLLPACVENTGIADNDRSSSPVIEVDSGRPEPEVDAGDGDGDADGGPSKVEGSAPAAGCVSSTPAPAGGCFGFYCGVTTADIRAETPSGSACGSDAELGLICEGNISHDVAVCARQIAISDPNNFSEKTAACVREKEQYDPVTDACLDCYVASADCARTKCLVPCLPGDNPECDECRETNGCTPDFYACGGIPNPQ